MRPKPMNGQALGFRKERKRKKEAQPSLYEENFLGSLEKDWTRIPWDSQKPGSSGNAERDQPGLGQLKEACLWTQGTKIDMSHKPPMVQKKADNLGINTS